MEKGLQITNRHGWTIEHLQFQEKALQKTSMAKRVTVSLFGCVNIRNGEFLCMETDRCNAQTFLTFLRYVLATYENQQIVMILDNARIHHAKFIQPFLNLHKDRLTLVFFPPIRPI